MVVDLAKIERIEKELREAKAQMWREDGDRYRILIREMSEVERNRILGSLTDRRERIFSALRLLMSERELVCVREPQAGIWSVRIAARQVSPKGVWGCISRGCTRGRS